LEERLPIIASTESRHSLLGPEHEAQQQHYQPQQPGYAHQPYPAQNPQYPYSQGNFQSVNMASGGYTQYGGVAQQPATGYGDGAGYSTTGYRNYNDHHNGAASSPSGVSQLKQRRSYDFKRFLYIPSTKWTWAFFLTILLQGIICLALERFVNLHQLWHDAHWISVVFAMFQHDTLKVAADPAAADGGKFARAIPTYLSLLIFAFVYELVLTYDALLSQNTIQIIGLLLMNFGIIVYTGIQKDQIKTAYDSLLKFAFINAEYWPRANPYLTTLPCLVAFFTVIMGGLTYGLFMEFGWKIYKQIGADRKMKNRYLIYQVCNPGILRVNANEGRFTLRCWSLISSSSSVLPYNSWSSSKEQAIQNATSPTPHYPSLSFCYC
jgi:hypothetical protein